MAHVTPFAPVEQPTLADIVTERIREAIISGQLQPGQRLSEPELATQLNVSRSPVREALQRLELERLLWSRTNQSRYVWTPAIKDVDEIFSLRVMIETLAAEWIINKFNEDDFAHLEGMIDDLRIALGTKDFLRVTREDKRFHEYMCVRSGHSRLMEWWHQIMGQWEVLVYRRNNHYPPYVEQTVLQDHTDIVAALESRDLNRVVTLHREINARVSEEIKSALTSDL